MPGTRVSLVPPSGFTLNEQIQGFADPNGATIVVVALDQPFVEMSADMKQAKRADMTILAARPTKLENGRLATWAHIRQAYGGETFFKWLLIFGDAKTATTVTVTVPERHAATYEAALAQSLGSCSLESGASEYCRPENTHGVAAPTDIAFYGPIGALDPLERQSTPRACRSPFNQRLASRTCSG